MVTNTASLRRVEGDVALPTYNMSLNVDVDSWAWSFSATLPSAALADLQPNEDGDPVELEALVNGMAFRVFAEKLTRDRTFRDSRINVGGRGMIAALDAPYAPELSFGNTEDLTLAQLIDQVLTDTGVSLGWDVTFGLEDWLVPGEVFSHRGSYMSAVNRLAQAGGGYVLPHPSDKAFSVLAKYPFAPWEWSTLDPDYELPANIVTREGIEWVDKPRYNRVYVSGVQAGVLGQLTRDGTAGDKIAPMIVDPLVTTAAAARQRGLPALADTGRIANVSLKLPVTADTNGVIQPGALVRYVDGDTTRVGLVRSSSVAVGLPEVWQTIGVETHVEPV